MGMAGWREGVGLTDDLPLRNKSSFFNLKVGVALEGNQKQKTDEKWWRLARAFAHRKGAAISPRTFLQ